MSVLVDPTVKYHLQQHLVNMHHQSEASALKIGTIEQLSIAAKISSSESVSQCFGCDGSPCSYPNLPERNYLVACVDRWINVQVFAIYSLEQMCEMHAQRGSGFVNNIEWRVLEISKEIETELLKGIIDLESGLIVSTPEAVWGKEYKN